MAKYNPEGPPIDPGGNVPDPENSSDFVVADSTSEWASKSLTEVKSILGLGTAAYTDSTSYDSAGTAASKITSSITDGDTTHSPDGNSVYDALAGKADVINATAESDFIVAGPSPFAWVKKTLAEVKSILGLGAAASNVTKWVSGTAYTEGDIVWSPINFLTYRRKADGAGTTDPSIDTTNWAAVIETLPFANNTALAQNHAIALSF